MPGASFARWGGTCHYCRRSALLKLCTASLRCFVTLADGTGQALKTLLALAHGTQASLASDTGVKVRKLNKSQSKAVSETRLMRLPAARLAEGQNQEKSSHENKRLAKKQKILGASNSFQTVL